jgi:hypothetical protein
MSGRPYSSHAAVPCPPVVPALPCAEARSCGRSLLLRRRYEAATALATQDGEVTRPCGRRAGRMRRWPGPHAGLAPGGHGQATIRAAGGIAGALRSRCARDASPEDRAVAAEPWIRFGPGDREQRPRLDGLRVLDFTHVIAGPTATKFLASLGAEVLRIDPPPVPELLDPHIDTGAGKRSATADPTDPQTLARVRELARTADVVMLGYRPGVLVGFGLDPDELHATHPQLAAARGALPRCLPGSGRTGDRPRGAHQDRVDAGESARPPPWRK